jgi:hypothetical protein
MCSREGKSRRQQPEEARGKIVPEGFLKFCTQT